MKSPDTTGDVSALRLALMAREARAASGRLLRADPIAIVGMSCRVPGADDPEALWQMLRDGRSGVRDVPPDRWDLGAWYDADPSAPGRMITRRAGFLDRVDEFDAEFFGILPREAERMDPQHRLVLEVACESLADAGLTNERLRGSRTGVYIASYHNDYTQLQYRDVEDIDERTLVGTLHSVLANRLSWFLDLRGPSLSIDTACSSSLVAVHLACQSLRMGETDCAVAGGVSLIITPDLMVSMSKVGFMSPDGRCKTFEATADGFGRGEGCGMVVLRRLSDAVADGDRVLAVIRGSAVNQDGHSTVLAAPSGPAQRALIAEALEGAQLAPSRIGFVEAHGTGTELGDPIEVEALAAVVGKRFPEADPCYLGSVKANLGHLEAAAGAVGLIKVVLALRHGALPGQPDFTTLSPHLDLSGTRLVVPTALTPWPRRNAPRCAAVSSFGVGGTNAHVVLEEAPELVAPASGAAAGDGNRELCLPLSAQHPEAVRALARRWVGFLEQPGVSLEAACRTAAVRRTHFDVRLAVVGRTTAELRSRLEAFESGEPSPDVAWGQRPVATALRVGFVFCGQGPQWPGMGRELLQTEPVFRDVIVECDALLRPLAGWSLLEELDRDEGASRLDQTEIAQPALFAIQVALSALLRSWGIEPTAVAGHSVGEIAALHQAGVLTLAEAVRIAWQRGRIMQDATGNGAMASVGLTGEEAAEVVAPHGERVVVAAFNAPRSVVLSGEPEALTGILAGLDARGVNHRRLPVHYAFHSPQMEPLRHRLVAALGKVEAGAPEVPFYSTVTGGLVTGPVFDAPYFGRNMREPVRLAPAVEAMAGEVDLILEIGPHPVLAAAMAETLAGRHDTVRILATLRRQRPERQSLLQMCGGLYAAGADLSWDQIVGAPEQPVSLPAYPWRRRRYWIRQRPAEVGAGRATNHPLLGVRLSLAAGITVFEGHASADWIHDHVIMGETLLPAAAMMELLSAAAREATGEPLALEAFAIHRPLTITPGDPVRWQVVVSGRVPDRCHVELHVASDGATGWDRVAEADAVAIPPSHGSSSPVTEREIVTGALYEHFADQGAAFGPRFRLLGNVRGGTAAARAEASLPGGLDDTGAYPVHPVLLDAALQLCSVAAFADGLPSELLLPVGAERVVLRGGLGTGPFRIDVRIERVAAGGIRADARIESADGKVLAELAGLRFAVAGASTADLLYEVNWRQASVPGTRTGTGTQWLIMPDAGGTGAAIGTTLTARGERCRLLGGAADIPTASLRTGHVVFLSALDLPRFEAGDAPARDDAVIRSLLDVGVALGHVPGPVRLTIVTRGAMVTGFEPAAGLAPLGAGAWGLAGVIAAESPSVTVKLIDLDPSELVSPDALVRELEADDTATRVALRAGQRLVPGLGRRRGTDEAGAVQRLEVTGAGVLEGVASRTVTPGPLAPTDLRLQVVAAGVNFRDVLLTLGMYEGPPVPLGAECVGLVRAVGSSVRGFEPGMLVYGYVPAALATQVDVPAAFVAPLPEGITPSAGAGLPVAYLTAMHGLERLAKLQAGETVLIHGGAGGVGLAAVHLARRRGAIIFATAGSDARRAVLAALGVQHVMDSRSLAFADQVLAATGGRGVDVVLNSLAGEFLTASLRVLAPGGRFVEIGKRGILTHDEMRRIRPDASYFPFDLGADAERDRTLLRPMLEELSAALADGSLPPLPVTTYALEDAPTAFRDMAQSKHAGKLVLLAPTAHHDAGLPRGTSLITGGLGALGLETARWLVQSGVRSLVLTGRHRPGPQATAVIDELRRAGADVRSVVADAADRVAMQAVLDMIAAEMAPLRGVFHAAGAVHDAALGNQVWDRCREVLQGKAHGAWVLHDLTRGLDLDCFVLYSAAGVVIGAAGQGVYPAANAELDALVLARRRAGLPALSIAWGPWAGAGMASGLGERAWAARGLSMLHPASALAALAQALRERAAYVVVMRMDWRRYAAQLPVGLDRAFFSSLLPEAVERPEASRGAGAFVAGLRALPSGARREALLDHLRQLALHVVGLDGATPVAGATPLKDIGLDSLMAVELRNAVMRSVGRPLPATLLFDYPTLDALGAHLVRLLQLEDAVEPEASAATRAAVEEVARLSEAEAYDLLLSELEGDSTGRSRG